MAATTQLLDTIAPHLCNTNAPKVLRASFAPDDTAQDVARKANAVLTADERCFFDDHNARTIRALMSQRHGVRM